MLTVKTGDTGYHCMHIAINKSRIKEYGFQDDWYSSNRKVYLNDNSEFQIELFNPTDKTIGAKITINGDSIGSSLLILYPGQRVWLERDFVSKNKFKFFVYSVEDDNPIVEKTIQHNGEITVELYTEKEKEEFNYTLGQITVYPSYDQRNVYDFTPYTSTCLNSTFTSMSTDDRSLVPTASSVSNISYCDCSISNAATSASYSLTGDSAINTCACYGSASACTSEPIMKETGIVSRSEHKSKQKFHDIDGIEFNMFPYKVETIKICPMSEKITTYKDVNVKHYCVNCGKKLKQTFKFCPVCGTKVE